MDILGLKGPDSWRVVWAWLSAGDSVCVCMCVCVCEEVKCVGVIKLRWYHLGWGWSRG